MVQCGLYMLKPCKQVFIHMTNEQEELEVQTGRNESGKSSISCGNVVTLDASALTRPQRLMGKNLIFVGIALVIAAVIGYFGFSFAMDNFVYASERQQEAVAQQISRGEVINAPAPALFVGLDDDGIRASLQGAGYSMFEQETSDGTTLELIKVPSDISPDLGKQLYTKGIAKIDPSDAAKLLTGMWRFDVSRGSEGTLMYVRYSDFISGSAAAALTSAMLHEGLSEDTVTESGIDESGNTYKVGSAVINGISTTWRVSVCPLKEIYNVSALPDTAMYVGMRFAY